MNLKTFFAILLFALFSLPVIADPVFPPMVGGDFAFSVQPGDLYDIEGVPLTPPTGSIGIVPSTGGATIGCVATPDPLASYLITAKVTATGQRESFKAQSFSNADCTGVASTSLSDNTAYTYPGMSPVKPHFQ